MLDFSRIQALTFDCYGTLIDWETGILAAVGSVLAPHGVRPPDADILRLYSRLEAEQERAPYQPYRAVLAAVLAGIGANFGVAIDRRDRNDLADSIPRWLPFPDTAPFLRRFFPRFRLAVCSNIDDSQFEDTRVSLGSPLHHVVTAQRCRSYKPNPAHFRTALDLLGLAPDQVLHIAESRYHDIAPASALGLSTAWVNRRRSRPGPTASGDANATPDLEVPDLDTLAAIIG